MANEGRVPDGDWKIPMAPPAPIAAPATSVAKRWTLSQAHRQVPVPTEIRAVVMMAQRLEPYRHFYPNMRLIHSAIGNHRGQVDPQGVPAVTKQGDGYEAFYNILQVAASLEKQKTRAMVQESVGYCIMLDGSNKGSVHTILCK